MTIHYFILLIVKVPINCCKAVPETQNILKHSQPLEVDLEIYLPDL